MMEEAFESEGVRGILHTPARPAGAALILTHGAGGNAQAPLLAAMARAFADSGCYVLRYDLPFRQQRAKGPPYPAQAARDREGIARAAEAVRRFARGRVFAGGHSYGGRQTAMWAAEQPGAVSGLLLTSYPLHPPGKPERKRTDFFPQLRAPALFVHGTVDAFGSIEEMREALALLAGPRDLVVVEGAGHDLKRAAAMGPEIVARFQAL
jgi:predicted alpha/beta-hydrolase family hydrolase